MLCCSEAAERYEAVKQQQKQQAEKIDKMKSNLQMDADDPQAAMDTGGFDDEQDHRRRCCCISCSMSYFWYQ